MACAKVGRVRLPKPGKFGRWFMATMLTAGYPIPAVAAEPGAAPGLVDLVQVADVTGLATSPDGGRVAFRVERARLDSNDYPSEWYVADLRSGAVRQVGPGGTAIYRDPGVPEGEMPVWSADGSYLYYRALVGDAVQVWRAGADGSGARAIVQDGADVRRISLGEDGRGLVVEVGASRNDIAFAETSEYDSGILVDHTVDPGQNIHRGALINGRRATQRLTGQWFERDGLLWQTPLRRRRIDLETMAITDLADRPAPAAARSPGEGIDFFSTAATSSAGDIATAAWDWRRDETSLTVSRRDGRGRSPTCTAAACRSGRIAWAAWRPGHDALVFSVQSRTANSLFIWDIAADEVRSVADGRGSFNGGRDPQSPCAVGADAVICVAAAAGAPPGVESVDLVTGARRILFDPNAPLRATTLQPEEIAWSGRAGHQYTGWLFRPPGATGRTPLFVTYYVCEGFLRGGLGDEWPLEALARAGITALCINKTRTEQPEGAHDQADSYRAALEGVEAAVALLDGRELIDPARVGMGGLSFGTESTLWAMIHSDLLAAASITSPTFESAYYWLNGVRGRDAHDNIRRYWQLGAPDETPERWRALSPAANVDHIRAPLLMQMPEHESRSSIELHARLTHSTTPVELYVFPDEPHLKFLPRHKLAAYQRNLDWFRFWLQGYVDPDPLKAGQYRRWATLAQRRDMARSP